MGTCAARPFNCNAMGVDQVCGCDGQVYFNPCDAQFYGQDINENGGCTPPPGTFACGPRFCTHGTQYCEGVVGGAASNAGSYACNPLPASCGATPTCACLTGTAACGNCTVSADGDLNTRCLVP
jgi:hypothetical protein